MLSWSKILITSGRYSDYEYPVQMLTGLQTGNNPCKGKYPVKISPKLIDVWDTYNKNGSNKGLTFRFVLIFLYLFK
jgi:hypothetical protein